MSKHYNVEPLQLKGLKTEPLAKRPSKVTVRDFARPYKRGSRFADYLKTLPAILAAHDFRRLVEAILAARRKNKPVLWGLGGHVIKVGLAPVLIDLLQRGYVQGIAIAGAALIHDFEIALVGHTSEDVPAQLGKGRFGMAEETGKLLNVAIRRAAEKGIGIGEGVGEFLLNLESLGAGHKAEHLDYSLLAAAYRARVPVTVHLALGTDIFHVHPAADGAALGQATLHDFRLFAALVRGLHPGGVYINVGSAVVLPEVFLKAVSVVRNLGHRLTRFTTANLDFIQHYRPTQNVLLRPGGTPIALTAPHELLIPLLAAALIEASPPGRTSPRRRARR
ncbi:MAG: hypothetical protein HY653_03910 [Acidobacteria bacterium]|nr:hypothetical protein [Acidobacteriota bacterium]